MDLDPPERDLEEDPTRCAPEVAATSRAWVDPKGCAARSVRRSSSHLQAGDTEAVNLIIDKTRRRAYGFRTSGHRRLRVLLAADGTGWGGPPTHRSEEPLWSAATPPAPA